MAQHENEPVPSSPGDHPSAAPPRGGNAGRGTATAPGAGSRREAIRFVVGFVVLFGAIYGALTWWPAAREAIVDPWTRFVTLTSSWVIGLFQPGLQHHGNFLFVPGHGIQIIDGCNGITPLSLLVAGVLAFPTRWRARFWGFLIGIPIVVFINLVRIAALWFLGLHYPDWFDQSHLYVAQAFVILATGGVWLWWLGRFAAPPPPPPSDTPPPGEGPTSGKATHAAA